MTYPVDHKRVKALSKKSSHKFSSYLLGNLEVVKAHIQSISLAIENQDDMKLDETLVYLTNIAEEFAGPVYYSSIFMAFLSKNKQTQLIKFYHILILEQYLELAFDAATLVGNKKGYSSDMFWDKQDNQISVDKIIKSIRIPESLIAVFHKNNFYVLKKNQTIKHRQMMI